MNKTCNCCKIIKPLSDYHIDKNRIKNICKDCSNKQSLKRYHKLTDDEKVKRSQLGRERMGKLYFKEYKLKTKYGLCLEDYNKMLSNQDGKCSICKIEFTEKTTPRVDHNHNSGTVRGLLCHSCNTAIGHLRENVETLKQAISYLEKYNDNI